MGYLISAGSSFHWVKSVEASTHGSGVLKLTLHGEPDVSDECFNRAEVLIFTDDVDLTGRLVVAINGAAAKSAEVEPRTAAGSLD